MNPQIEKLYQITVKKSRLIIGLMSGTSLDGLDVALCRISGSGKTTKVELLEFETHNYEESVRRDIRKIFTRETVNLRQLTLLNAQIGRLHGELVLRSLKNWNIIPQQVDAIASHGQTIYHSPKSLHQNPDLPNATLQIGDGDHIAITTGILTVNDFRQKHIAAGGEGAPLAAYGDALIFSNETENRIMLNMGGIANFTFLPAGDFSKILVTDTGPGNTLIDAVMQQYFNLPFDKNGTVAKSGKIIPEILQTLKTHQFFELPVPKTTGQELFNISFLDEALNSAENLSSENFKNEDIVATLTRFSAETIAYEILKLNTEAIIYSSGGGIHNPILMNHLKELLPNFQVKKTDTLGISGDAKEAVLFAVLANQMLSGSPIKIADLPEINMGKISFPS